MSEQQVRRTILDDPDFKELSRQKNRISLVLTVVILVVYFTYMLLIAFSKSALSAPVANGTLGIPIGIGVIILAWVLTGIYVRWANTQYDALVEKVKQKISE
ncbi:MAG: DUF485 domain-containing protein [Abitibacteriaceae bacterium]|nr:DUF485 domain-containing protein [Abditibacteriaceae bacterium]MBV9866593.1 DUF485 domain-containing protein [Abditibacteriaceae bacterium]